MNNWQTTIQFYADDRLITRTVAGMHWGVCIFTQPKTPLAKLFPEFATADLRFISATHMKEVQ